MTVRYTHTNIVSKDWKSLASFYIEVFGCEPLLPERDLAGEWLAKGTGLENPHLRGQHLRLPGYGAEGPTLEIFQYDDLQERCLPIAANRLGLGHLAFEVQNVAHVLEVVLMYGGQALGELVEREIEGVGRLAFVYATDPEGNILEIQSWHKHASD